MNEILSVTFEDDTGARFGTSLVILKPRLLVE